jgi:hypothetical protein
MLLIQNLQITRFKHENGKVISDPSYSLQNEVFVIFVISLHRMCFLNGIFFPCSRNEGS